MAEEYIIEVACDNPEGEDFVEWLIAKGHDAVLGDSTGDYVDGVWTSTDNEAAEIMSNLWLEYCRS